MIAAERLPIVSASSVMHSAKINIELNCGEFQYLNEIFYVDILDFNKLINVIHTFSFNESEEYPYYFDTNRKKITLLQSIYIYSPLLHKYVFKNGNKKDLRKDNVSVYHIKHDEIIKKYPEAKYIGGHHVSQGKNAFLIQNPIWELEEDGNKYYLMYGFPDKLALLCEEGLKRIREFEREKNNGKRITWSCIGVDYFSGSIPNDRLYGMHQIIMGHYGNGRGTSNISIDHIDRNSLNNCISNLRIATRKMQEENSKGIMEGTKRDRNWYARPLPEGITHEMMQKCMVYNVNTYNKEKGSTREYFSIENHPKLDKVWESSKSNKISIMDKYNETIKVLENLKNDIYPEKKVRELPPHMTIKKMENSETLVFDWKKKDGIRMNSRFKLPDGEYDLEEQINKMREIIEEKYGEKI